jgi:hypothetical protein
VVRNDRSLAGQYDGLLKSIVTEQELFEVLRRPRIASKVAPSFFDNLRTMFGPAELVSITQRVSGCRDPKNNKFLELEHLSQIISEKRTERRRFRGRSSRRSERDKGAG